MTTQEQTPPHDPATFEDELNKYAGALWPTDWREQLAAHQTVEIGSTAKPDSEVEISSLDAVPPIPPDTRIRAIDVRTLATRQGQDSEFFLPAPHEERLPTGPGRRRLAALAASVLVVAALGYLAFEVADSNEVVLVDENTLNSETSLALFQQASGAAGLQSVVRAPEGFLGLVTDFSDQNLPSIVRSLDGVQWAAVDAWADDSIPVGLPDRYTRVFEQLLRTDTGYAVLMTTSEFESEGDRSPSLIRIQRLTSPDGATWSLDPSFVPLDSTGQFTRIFSHGAEAFVSLTWPRSPVDNALRELLEANVNDGSNFEDACDVELMGGDQFFVIPCLEGEALAFDAANMIEPDRFAELAECANYITDRNLAGPTFWVVYRDRSATELAGANPLLMAPTVADDGRVVALDASGTPWLDPSVCDGLPGVDEFPPPSVVVWEPGAFDEPVRFLIPDDIELVELLDASFPPPEPAFMGSEMVILMGSVVTSINIDTGEWVQLLTLPSNVNEDTSKRFSNDGTQLIQLDSAKITITELRTGEEHSSDHTHSPNSTARDPHSLLYADDEVIFAQLGDAVFRIDPSS